MPSAHLADRAAISVSGAEAGPFLDRLVTCSLDGMAAGTARFGALLSPQGKILADFIVFAGPDEGSLWLDTPAVCAADLVKRLNLYRLRAKLAIEDRSDVVHVLAGWNGAPGPAGALAVAPDPRLAALGWRALVEAGAEGDANAAAFQSHRIALGIPEVGRDLPFGEPFPHETLMDQLAGIDFGKGCYVGQEVVSRMQHRGTARTRVVPLVYADGGSAPLGAEVTGGGKHLGRTGEAEPGRGLAAIRLDRVADAMAAGEPILAGGLPVRLDKPDWIRFPFPGELRP